MFEEFLVRAILKLQFAKAHIQTLEVRGTAQSHSSSLTHSFLPSFLGSNLQAAPRDEVQVDMRCSTAGDVPLTKDSWHFCVCSWDFLGVVGKKKKPFKKQRCLWEVGTYKSGSRMSFPNCLSLWSRVLCTESCSSKEERWHWHLPLKDEITEI